MRRLCSRCTRFAVEGDRHCSEHRHEQERRVAAKRVAYGYGRAHWQRIRRQRLELAGYRCELRITCTGAPATHVHLDAHMRGLHDLATIDNTRACCAACSGAIDAPRSHQTQSED